jgi:hypothetical protein
MAAMRQLRGGDRLTNIGASVPGARPLTEPAQQFRPGSGQGLPVGLPVARIEGEGPGAVYVAADPLWIARWQSSPNPADKWVQAYRWFVADVKYETWGPNPAYRIDFLWKDHAHAYLVPFRLFDNFRKLATSPGVWFHDFIVGRGWKRGQGALWPNWAISR